MNLNWDLQYARRREEYRRGRGESRDVGDEDDQTGDDNKKFLGSVFFLLRNLKTYL